MSLFDQQPHRIIAAELGQPFSFWERIDFYFPTLRYRLHIVGARIFARSR